MFENGAVNFYLNMAVIIKQGVHFPIEKLKNNNLREFVLTTVILTPAREVGWVVIAVFPPFSENCRANRANRANSERLIWNYN